MKLLVIYGVAPATQSAWPWSSAGPDVSVRHLRAADLSARIAEADFIALSVSCGMLRATWPAVEKRLVERQVPMIAFNRLDARLLGSIRTGAACIATLSEAGHVELECRAQRSAFERMALSMGGEEIHTHHALPPDSADLGAAADEGAPIERVTRFIYQGE